MYIKEKERVFLSYPEIPYRSAVIIHIIATCIKIYISIYRKDPSNQSNTMSEYSFTMSNLT